MEQKLNNERNKIFLLLFLILTINKSIFSQTNNSEKVIEGGKLILDIFKTVKDNKANNNAKLEVSKKSDVNLSKVRDVCFYNPTAMRINIEITVKGNLTNNICNSTIPANDSICCFAVKDGLYHIKITEAGNLSNIIKENDIIINETNIESMKLIIK
jgi:hypothetical protein